MKDRRILVTGGAGFIGSHVVESLLQKGAVVHVLDNLSTGKKDNLPPGARFFHGDILDPDCLDQALDGVDSVIHLAARVAIRDSLQNFHKDASTNVMGTLLLMRYCADRKVRKFVFGSSMAVYADSKEPHPISETYPQEPISPYGISKLAGEKYIELLARPLEMDYVSLRFFNVYGLRQAYTPYVGVITIFIERLLRGDPPMIFGDGDQMRDFVHVKDIVNATLLALNSPVRAGTFNVGTGTGSSVNQIARLLIDKIRPGLEPAYDDPQPGEIRNSIADISQIREQLGFEPQGVLSEKIDEVIAWKQGC